MNTKQQQLNDGQLNVILMLFLQNGVNNIEFGKFTSLYAHGLPWMHNMLYTDNFNYLEN